MSPISRGLWAGAALAFVVTFFFDISQADQSTQTRFPELLTYSQLMSLTPKKRELYINGVRAMLVELSKESAKQQSNFFSDRTNSYKGYIALLDTVLPPAAAAPFSTESKVVPDKANLVNGIPTCAPSNKIVTQATRDSTTGVVEYFCRIEQEDNASCPEDFVPVAQKSASGNFMCATASSFWALSESSQVRLRTPRKSRDEKVNQAFAKSPSKSETTAVRCSAPLVAFEFSGSIGCVQRQPYGDTMCPDGFIAVNQMDDGNYLCMSDETFNKFSSADQKKLRKAFVEHTGDGARTVNFINSNGKQTDVPVIDAKTKISGGGQCAPIPVECKKAATADEFRKYRETFYQNGSHHTCIYAGNISKYMSATKAPGQCERPSTNTLANVLKKAGAGNVGDLSCSGKGVPCNPLLYGVQKDTHDAFCSSPRTVNGKGPTEQCDSLSTEETRASDFLDQQIPGIQNLWDEFRAGFNSICKEDESSRNFHCVECGVIAKRLPEVNKLVFNSCDGPNATAKKAAPAGGGNAPSANPPSGKH